MITFDKMQDEKKHFEKRHNTLADLRGYPKQTIRSQTSDAFNSPRKNMKNQLSGQWPNYMQTKYTDIAPPEVFPSRGQSIHVDIAMLKKQSNNSKFGVSYDLPFDLGPF